MANVIAFTDTKYVVLAIWFCRHLLYKTLERKINSATDDTWEV